jgi:hypothetical protein
VAPAAAGIGVPLVSGLRRAGLQGATSTGAQLTSQLDPPPPGGGGLVQIGTEGGLLESPVRHDAIEIAPAQRYDVLVDFGGYAVGQVVRLVNEFGSGGTEQVLEFRIARSGKDDTRVPEGLSAVTRLDPARAEATRLMRFQHDKVRTMDRMEMDGWTVNGHPFTPDCRPTVATSSTPRSGWVRSRSGTCDPTPPSRPPAPRPVPGTNPRHRRPGSV